MLAVRVAVSVEAGEDVIALNPTLLLPAGTVTLEGTCTAPLLLASDTAIPPLGAAAFRETVHGSVAPPVSDPLLQVSPVTDVPQPCSHTTDCEPVEELLSNVTLPCAGPGAVGLKTRFTVTLCLGARVTGNPTPDRLKLLPETVAELILSGATPVDVKTIAWLPAVPTSTELKEKLTPLMLRVALPWACAASGAQLSRSAHTVAPKK